MAFASAQMRPTTEFRLGRVRPDQDKSGAASVVISASGGELELAADESGPGKQRHEADLVRVGGGSRMEELFDGVLLCPWSESRGLDWAVAGG